ncbi:MAG: hypothetical protein MR025_01560 [Helicobacter trogontum]|uniref:Uncharacterized protein n=1 Tax=Helicobacter trogontum TaxID=50960 RepID=A0A4U8TH39_9HELI|nr:hypothetical protein [Helicobacter trogontum]MCI5786129.1 hypothetical protein [Helicobacter trogontum]TLD99383.1 hypothetical protein LS80_001695 [Helicobacter trogontum]
MIFEAILSNIYSINNTFNSNVSDEFGTDILANEMADMIRIGIELCETEANINNKIREVDFRLQEIQSMRPLC